MTEKTTVSPAVQRINEQREKAAEAQAAAKELSAQTSQEQAPVTQSEAVDAVKEESKETPPATDQQSADDKSVPLIDITESKEPPKIDLDLSNPPAQQQTPKDNIDLLQVAKEAREEQASAKAAVVKPAVAQQNFYLARAGQLLDNYEKVTSRSMSFDAVGFAKAHASLSAFLFDSLTKATGKDFIELMDMIIGRMRDTEKRKDYYNAQRFFRGAEKTSESYAALINVFFDMSNAINRQRLMSVDFARIFGAAIGEKIKDYINRV